MKKTPPNLADQLRRAIEASEQNVNQIALAAEVAPISLYRFMAGERDLYLETAGRVAAVLGLELKDVSN